MILNQKTWLKIGPSSLETLFSQFRRGLKQKCKSWFTFQPFIVSVANLRGLLLCNQFRGVWLSTKKLIFFSSGFDQFANVSDMHPYFYGFIFNKKSYYSLIFIKKTQNYSYNARQKSPLMWVGASVLRSGRNFEQ